MDFQTQKQNFKVAEIGGCSYSMTRFSPTPALKLSTRLAKFLGPAIAAAVSEIQAAGGAGKKVTAKDLNVAKIVQAILPSLDEEVVATTVKDLISCCSYENVELKGNAFEKHFQENMQNLLPLAAQVVEYQFSDFLSGLLTGRL